MIKTKLNTFNFQFEEYKDALKKSLYDDNWIKNLYTDKDNVYNIFRYISTSNYIKEASDFIREPSVKKLILARSQKVLDDKIFSRIAEAGQAEQNAEYVKEIEAITYENAKKLEYLINEFSENSRNFNEFNIKPQPENISDTWKPIKNFHVKYDDKEASVAIEQNIVVVKSADKIIKEYFDNRNASKLIKRKYIKKSDLSLENYTAARKYLLRSKEYFINLSKAYHESTDNMYKILYRGNQTVNTGEYEMPIFSQKILIGHIM